MKSRDTEFQRFLQAACKGTTVTPRELVVALTIDDIRRIKSGDLIIDDVREIVKDLADSKDNAAIYKIPISKKDTGTFYA